MLISELSNSGASASLEATIRFAAARQRLIAHNIANISTPDFVQVDVAPREFQKALKQAVEKRRAAGGGDTAPGGLSIRSDSISIDHRGNMTLKPHDSSGNILFHDRNNRDVEGLMAAQAENLGVYRTAVELLRSRAEILRVAISERV